MKNVKMIMISIGVAATINLCSPALAYTQAQGYQVSKFFDLTYSGQVHQYSKHPYNGMRFPDRIRAPGQKLFIFSPRHKIWAAYAPDGSKIATGIANGGADYCAELGRPCHTPTGMHAIHGKKGPECVSNKFPLGEG